MRRLLCFFVLLLPTAILGQTSFDVMLSRVQLSDSAKYYKFKEIAFSPLVGNTKCIPKGATQVQHGTLIDNAVCSPVEVLSYSDASGAPAFVVDTNADGDFSEQEVTFVGAGPRKSAIVDLTIRPKSPAETPWHLAYQLLLDQNHLSYRLAECREGMLPVGNKKFRMRLLLPPDEPLLYKLSTAAAAVDTNGDSAFTMRWRLSGNQVIPAERITLNEPFRIDTCKRQGVSLDQAGSKLTLRSYASDSAGAIGFYAPNLTFADLQGQVHSVASLPAKPRLFFFWSTSCSHCEEVRLALDSLIQQSDTGLQTVAMAAESKTDQISTFLANRPYGGMIAPFDSLMWSALNPKGGTPAFCLVDAQGVVRFTGVGSSLFPIVRQLLLDELRKQ